MSVKENLSEAAIEAVEVEVHDITNNVREKARETRTAFEKAAPYIATAALLIAIYAASRKVVVVTAGSPVS